MIAKEDILDLIKIDEGAKKVFLAMSREDQLLAILTMQSYARDKLAELEKKQIKQEEKFDDMQKEVRSYRRYREKKEKDTEDNLTTTQKIDNAFAKRFGKWGTLLFGVLQQVITVIILGLLALIFANRLP